MANALPEWMYVMPYSYIGNVHKLLMVTEANM